MRSWGPALLPHQQLLPWDEAASPSVCHQDPPSWTQALLRQGGSRLTGRGVSSQGAMSGSPRPSLAFATLLGGLVLTAQEGPIAIHPRAPISAKGHLTLHGAGAVCRATLREVPHGADSSCTHSRGVPRGRVGTWGERGATGVPGQGQQEAVSWAGAPTAWGRAEGDGACVTESHLPRHPTKHATTFHRKPRLYLSPSTNMGPECLKDPESTAETRG